MINKGTTRYPGIKSIYAIPAEDYISNSQFGESNKIDASLDTSVLETNDAEDENGNAIEEHTITCKVAGISPGALTSINKKYVLKLTFFYSSDIMYIGNKEFPAMLGTKNTSGQTGGNFIGSEITFSCSFPAVRRI